MKIQIISLTRPDYKIKKIGKWYNMPYWFEKLGHEVKYNTKKDWKRWYIDYLSFNPDIVIVVGLIGGLVGFFKKVGLMRKPLVVDWTDFYTEDSGKSRGITLSAFLEYFSVSCADLIITPSRYLESVSKNLGKKCVYLEHGVDSRKTKKIKLKGDYKILYIGNQFGNKRVDELVNASKKVKCDLYLLGEINRELKAIAPKNCHFLGRVEYKDVSLYINAADVCVVTSDDDSTLKMFEYIKAGKPILAPKNRIGYVLSHLETAYLCNDLEVGINKLRDKKLRKKIANNLKQIKSYKWKEIAQRYIRILGDLK